MKADLQTHVAFYLTGKKAGGGLEPATGLGLRPALFAGFHNLTQLRYDFPVVLVNLSEQAYVQPLSAVMDGVLNQIATEEDSDRLTKHVLRLEAEIRALAAGGASGRLSVLWDAAASRLLARDDVPLRYSLERARAALTIDGEIVDCNNTMPSNLLRHAWSAVQEAKARQFHAEISRLILKLSHILQSDFARSGAGRTAERLRASVGAPHGDIFDFAAMSSVLSRGAECGLLPEPRRKRITRALSVLESQRFFARGDATPAATESYPCAFDTCAAALRAYRERLPEMTELSRAIAIAQLEIDGEYKDGTHDVLFEELVTNEIDPADLARFPDYLICVSGDRMSADEHAQLMQMLSSGLPVKVLVQTDDLLGESTLGDGHLAFAARSRQLSNMAIGLNEVYVLQASASHLCQSRERIVRGLTFRGPALFSVFSGATPGAGSGSLSPYLNAAAAMESRAFPAFTYDPSAGPNWAARFYLDANPQAERDWPVQGFAYEDETHQRIAMDIAFTPVDFVSCDPRYLSHFARVPRAQWNGSMISVDEHLAHDPQGVPEKVPSLLMVDADNVLQKVIVDDKLIRAVQRCRETWHSLQELGGIHNSHAEKLLAREKQAWQQDHQRREVQTGQPLQPAAAASAVAATAPAAAPVAAAVAAEAEPAPSPDEAYIETPRCTTCNECTQINDKMFAYNENKQAYVANPDAGTYAQLVEAAESCQVCIIHPGKPRNPGEPGLEELRKRAEPFL